MDAAMQRVLDVVGYEKTSLRAAAKKYGVFCYRISRVQSNLYQDSKMTDEILSKGRTGHRESLLQCARIKVPLNKELLERTVVDLGVQNGKFYC